MARQQRREHGGPAADQRAPADRAVDPAQRLDDARATGQVKFGATMAERREHAENPDRPQRRYQIGRNPATGPDLVRARFDRGRQRKDSPKQPLRSVVSRLPGSHGSDIRWRVHPVSPMQSAGKLVDARYATISSRKIG